MNVSGNVITIAIDKVTGTCKVEPRESFVRIGDAVSFSNQTAASVSVLISKENMFSVHRFRIGAREEQRMIVEESIEPGEYPYAVFCREIDDFAHASSMPIIIIRR